MRLQVRPIYGWGRYTAKGDPVDVPAPFEFDATETGNPGEVSGYLDGVQNPLSGLSILLWHRHSLSDGHCNLLAFRGKPASAAQPIVTGFAEVREKGQSKENACAFSRKLCSQPLFS